MSCCVCISHMADLYHAIHPHAMAYSLLLAYRHFSSLLSSVFLLPQNWFKKDLTIESLSFRLQKSHAHPIPSCKMGSPPLLVNPAACLGQRTMSEEVRDVLVILGHMKNAQPQKVKVGSAIHLPFDAFEAIDLPFHLPLTPRL